MEFHYASITSGDTHMSLTKKQAKMLTNLKIAFKCDICDNLHLIAGKTWVDVDTALCALAWGDETRTAGG